MEKINSNAAAEISRFSPKGRFGAYFKGLSTALGGDRFSTDLLKRHPFDVGIARIPPGKSLCPYHAHSAQWEFYLVLSGEGAVRDAEGTTAVRAGDAFLFKPGEAHELSNQGAEDFVYYIIADNPFGECCYYPDSDKWAVGMPGKSSIVRSENLNYFDGEE